MSDTRQSTIVDDLPERLDVGGEVPAGGICGAPTPRAVVTVAGQTACAACPWLRPGRPDITAPILEAYMWTPKNPEGSCLVVQS